MMRIVGGTLRSRKLSGPSGATTRPTSDRVRESLFNILAHSIENLELANARVLDLFAGTGALGFEALSRGAKFCLFVEENQAARAVIRENADSLGVIGLCKIWRRDATQLGSCEPQSPFDLIFVDPPYGKGLGEKALSSAVTGGWFGTSATAVLEESIEAIIPDIAGLNLIDRREYGDTQVRIYSKT